jgi:hypothetical protein
VGMAYVVTRPHERYEIRESIHTPKGPRSRSLANFAQLSDDVLRTAAARATRPFDAAAVRAAAERAGAPIRSTRTSSGRTDPDPVRHFVESSRRMAATVEGRPGGPRPDAGEALIALLDFADQIRPFTPARAPEPLRFPPLAGLVAARRVRPPE